MVKKGVFPFFEKELVNLCTAVDKGKGLKEKEVD